MSIQCLKLQYIGHCFGSVVISWKSSVCLKIFRDSMIRCEDNRKYSSTHVDFSSEFRDTLNYLEKFDSSRKQQT